MSTKQADVDRTDARRPALGGDWADTVRELPSGPWHNQLTGDAAEGPVALGELLRRFPVALLARAEADA
jgi:maltooligosyltrehalose synthase